MRTESRPPSQARPVVGQRLPNNDGADRTSAAPRRLVGGQRPTISPQGEPLTRREREVHRWIAEGKRDSEIARLLGISVHTVSKHVQHIFRKLGVENRTSAARLYVLKAHSGNGDDGAGVRDDSGRRSPRRS